MIVNYIGFYSLVLGLFSSILIFVLSIRSYILKILDKRIFSVSFLQLFFVLTSFTSLIICFLISDFGNETVFNNSHSNKPIFYKISGTWGNHEGSLLLWLLVLTLFLFLFILKSKNELKSYRCLTLVFQQIIIIGFFLFVLITSNPFNYLFPVPLEGLGLNPILQDPALAIHPPILYLGYVGSSLIFSATLAAVIENYVSKEWAKNIKIWILISWIFLTLGIALGSIWAYYELGWGGFWFWDPVENVSLMPWICLTALLHCILVLEKRDLLKSWAVILSIGTFTLSMCGTFLVRSGILNSVHTFANDPSRGIFILSFLFFLILMSLAIFFIFFKEEKKNYQKIYFLSKEVSIIINNWFLMYFLSVVLIGTLYPIFLEVIIDHKISVGPPFYNKLIIPFLILFLIFMSFAPGVKWIRENNIKKEFKLLILFIISLLTSFFIYDLLGKKSLINTVLLSASLYLFLITIKDFFSKELLNLPQKISHLGFSMLILRIILNSILSNEITINLKVGEKFSFKNENIYFESLQNEKNKNYQAVVGIFKIEDEKKNIYQFQPELRIYDQPEIITSEADIKMSLFTDKFLVMNKIKGNEYFNVRYQIKPFMLWIWVSSLLLTVGAFLSLYRRLYEK